MRWQLQQAAGCLKATTHVKRYKLRRYICVRACVSERNKNNMYIYEIYQIHFISVRACVSCECVQHTHEAIESCTGLHIQISAVRVRMALQKPMASFYIYVLKQ